MVNFGSFAEGFRNQRKDDLATRKDIAQSFSNFRKENPYATLSEMQNQMDILSGGRNYLRKGLPNQDTLSKIAAGNLEAKNQADFQREFENQNNLNTMYGQLRTRADEFFAMKLNSKEYWGLDDNALEQKLNTWRDEFMKTLPNIDGITLELDKAGIEEVFSKQNLRTKRREKWLSVNEDAKRLIEEAYLNSDDNTNERKVSNKEIADIANILGVGEEIIKKQVGIIVDKKEKEAHMHYDATIPNILSDIKNTIGAYQNSWQDGTVNEQKLINDAKALLAERSKKVGVSMSTDDINTRAEAMVKQIVAAWQDSKDKRTMESNNWLAGKKEEAITWLDTKLNDQTSNLYRAIERNDSEAAKKVIAEYVSTKIAERDATFYFGADSHAKLVAELQAHITAKLTTARQSMLEFQEDNWDRVNKEAKSQAALQIQALADNQNKMIEDIFGTSNNPNPNSSIASGKTGNVVIAIKNLATKYHLAKGDLNNFILALETYNGSDDFGSIELYLDQNFGKSLMPLEKYKTNLTKQVMQQHGAFGDIKTFSKFLKKMDEDFEATHASASDILNTIELDDPYGSGKITNIITNLRALKGRLVSVFDQAQQTQDIWVTKAQPDQWNTDEANASLLNLKTKVDELIKAAEEKRRNLTPPESNREVNVETQFDDEVTQIYKDLSLSPAKREEAAGKLWVTRAREIVQTMIDRNVTNATMPRTNKIYGQSVTNEDFAPEVIDQIFEKWFGVARESKRLENSPYNYKQIEIMNEFLRDAKNLYKVAQSKDRMERFYADPLAYIEALKKGDNPDHIDLFQEVGAYTTQ